MNTQNFLSENYLSLGLLAVAIGIMITAIAQKYSTVKNLLRLKTAENRNLVSQLKEYESDQSIALEHLTAKKDRVIKSLRIQHAKWREATWAHVSKQIENLKAAHVQELAALEKQIKSTTAIKWESAAALATIDKNYQQAIVATQTELERKHEEAMQERHYQFESKRMQYATFFKILSEYNVENKLRTNEKVMPVLNDFERNYIRALNMHNKKNQEAAITVAKKRMARLVLEAQLELTRINDEKNAVLLFCSEVIAEKMEILIDHYHTCLCLLTDMLTQFIPLLLGGKTDQIAENLERLNKAEEDLTPLIDELFFYAKEEIGEF